MLSVGIGDIHGRLHRVADWLRELERALGKPIDLAISVGDLEAFRSADDHRRKAVKRGMPVEYVEYAEGRRSLPARLHFIGGNNEDFDTLFALPEGGRLAGGLEYLGQVGARYFSGLRVAYLSGIYAPRHYTLSRQAPANALSRKHAGYYREPEFAQLADVGPVELLVLHEWPRGLLLRKPGAPALQAHRKPWLGSPIAKELVRRLQPRWLWCGHAHVPLATTVHHPGGKLTRVACLDEADQPEGAIHWIEWDGGLPVRAGWGVSGRVDWLAGQPWEEGLTPKAAAPEPE